MFWAEGMFRGQRGMWKVKILEKQESLYVSVELLVWKHNCLTTPFKGLESATLEIWLKLKKSFLISSKLHKRSLPKILCREVNSDVIGEEKGSYYLVWELMEGKKKEK